MPVTREHEGMMTMLDSSGAGEGFQWCIVDESAQWVELSVLIPLTMRLGVRRVLLQCSCRGGYTTTMGANLPGKPTTHTHTL